MIAKKLYFTFVFFLIAISFSFSNNIPSLKVYNVKQGIFKIEPTRLAFSEVGSQQISNDIDIFKNFMFRLYNTEIKKPDLNKENQFIILISNPKLSIDAYTIQIDSNKIIINGNGAGIYYGLISLCQLVKGNIGNYYWQNAEIADSPKFSWRGMHLDVSRHFFDIDYIKKYIDILSFYKLNTFHWHLTDDQGWRIEIKKYPNLTAIGSKRAETQVGKNFNPFIGDSIAYEGYYTQQQIKDVVIYAGQRHINIVPEIEMPGHCMAALSAYPMLACAQDSFKTMTTWGVSEKVFCNKEFTINFLKDVLTEVCDLFPSPYIHIGGDEVPKSSWKNCSVCQGIIKSKGLKNEDELQSYFISRMDSFLSSKGKKMIGWDEIMEGGLTENATVMSWRGEEGGIVAAKLKHQGIMCPGSHCYFDHYQGLKRSEPLAIGGYTPLEKIFNYNPIPAQLDPSLEQYILGVQANLWTEYIPTKTQADYMLLPRLAALSEVAWNNQPNRDFNLFKKNIITHFNYYNLLGYNYATTIYDIVPAINFIRDTTGITLTLKPCNNRGKIFYTTQTIGSNFIDTPKLYTKPLQFSSYAKVRAVFVDDSVEICSKVYEQEFVISKSTGCRIGGIPPNEQYNKGGLRTLVDGVLSDLPWSASEAVGWKGNNAEMVIDFGKEKEISNIVVCTLKDEASWIYLPTSISFEVAGEDKNFVSIYTMSSQEIDLNKRYQVFTLMNFKPRYIRLFIRNKGIIPAGKPGEGEKAWLFLDEIGVY
jgi:hexosaminidase